MKQMAALLLALTLLGQTTAVWAESASRESGLTRASYGVGSVLGTLAYAPVKAAVCLIGGFASGFVFLQSGGEAAVTVAGASCKGTWVITPDVLRGEEPFSAGLDAW